MDMGWVFGIGLIVVLLGLFVKSQIVPSAVSVSGGQGSKKDRAAMRHTLIMMENRTESEEYTLRKLEEEQ